MMLSQYHNTHRKFKRLAKALIRLRVYAQSDLSLRWSHISHCWKSHVAAHFKGATMHLVVCVWLKTLSRRDVTL